MGKWREVSDESTDEQDGLCWSRKLGHRNCWGQRYQWSSTDLSTAERASLLKQARGNLLRLHVVCVRPGIFCSAVRQADRLHLRLLLGLHASLLEKQRQWHGHSPYRSENASGQEGYGPVPAIRPESSSRVRACNRKVQFRAKC